MRNIAVGLLGAGNVGQGVARILAEHGDSIAARVGAEIGIKRVLVRDPGRGRQVGALASCMTTDPAEVLDDPDIRVVVEVMGGLVPARAYVERALEQGKHVVTANKALLADAGPELLALARRHRVALRFEGAVAGGIPILRAIREGLASDRIESVTGIINGTCNFILDGMSRRGWSYAEALAEAQGRGFAEADPSFDVDGVDAAQKLVVLCLAAWGLAVAPDDIPTEGITAVEAVDIVAARKLGFAIKLLAQATHGDDGLGARVSPVLVPLESVFAGIHGSYNGILVESRALGQTLYCGPGAGMMPTGSAVVSDMIDVCRDLVAFRSPGPDVTSQPGIERIPLRDGGDETYENYLRVRVANTPGVLGRVATCLGQHGVSIKHIFQDVHAADRPVDMVVLTEPALERSVVQAVAGMEALMGVMAPVLRLRAIVADLAS